MGRSVARAAGTAYHDHMNVHQQPIGVFDSGLGGLSVLREVRALLPGEAVVYVADRAYCPYGGRPPEEILARSAAIAGALVGRGAKLLVVACNTASTVALPALRARFPGVPIVGMVPAVKPAATATRCGKIGVLATPRTVAGEVLAGLIREHCRGAEVYGVPAPGLVELVEAGETDGPRVEAALRPLLEPLLARGVDTVVLGCTHYPFLRGAIRRLVGPGVAVIDSGEAVARRTRDVLASRCLAAPGGATGGGGLTLLTSAEPERVGGVAARLLGAPVATGLLAV
jgi:glutamate racemase